jgi:DNA-binding XRE family transcriptional regulator
MSKPPHLFPPLPPEHLAAIQEARRKIESEEKDEIQAKLRDFRRRREQAAQELQRTIGALRGARLAKGYSIDDVERISGVDRATIVEIESMKAANPTIETLVRIADALGMDLLIGVAQREE